MNIQPLMKWNILEYPRGVVNWDCYRGRHKWKDDKHASSGIEIEGGGQVWLPCQFCTRCLVTRPCDPEVLEKVSGSRRLRRSA